MNENCWKHKHLHDVTSLSVEDVRWILSYAKNFYAYNRDKKKSLNLLDGKNIILFFAENSTRTRISFDIAGQRLGATVHPMQEAGSSLLKGETLRDTILSLQAMQPDLFVLRTKYSGGSEYCTQFINSPLINAGDGLHAHPTQALLDLFILDKEWYGQFENKIVTIVGDIKHSRVARSNAHLLQKMGITVRFCGPNNLLLLPAAFPDIQLFTDIDEALDGADAVIALRLQGERQEVGIVPNEYYSVYGMTQEKLAKAKPSCVLLHPGPITPGVDIEPMLALEEKNSRIYPQVEAGVAVRMALLYLFCNIGKELPKELSI